MACVMDWALCVMLCHPCGWVGTAWSPSPPLKPVVRIYNAAWARFLQYPACNKGKYRQKSQVLIFVIKKMNCQCSLPQYCQVSAH